MVRANKSCYPQVIVVGAGVAGLAAIQQAKGMNANGERLPTQQRMAPPNLQNPKLSPDQTKQPQPLNQVTHPCPQKTREHQLAPTCKLGSAAERLV
jgi:hypothetical protein